MERAQKRLKLTILLIFTVSLLICVSAGYFALPKVAADREASPEIVTATIIQSRYTKGLQDMIEKLRAEENIEIQCQIIPDNQTMELMRMRAAANKMTDIVDFNFPNAYGWIDAERYFEDLSGEEWASRLLASENVEKNGRIYAFPFQSLQGVHGVIYNKQIFEEAGIKDFPKNEEEFLTVCEQIREDTDAVPVTISQEPWVTQIIAADLISKNLGEHGEETAGKLKAGQVKWNEIPELAPALDFYFSLFRKGYVNEDYYSASYQNCIEQIGQGKAAMHINGNFFVDAVKSRYPDASVGMFFMPGSGGNLTGIKSSVGFALSKTSEKKDTVKRIFELWSTADYGNLYFKDSPGFPAFSGIDGGTLPEYLESIRVEYINRGKVGKDFFAMFDAETECFENTLFLYLAEYAYDKRIGGKEVLEQFQQDYEAYKSR